VKKIAEEMLLADLYLSLRGRKKKKDNWIDIAKKCQQLVDYYSSPKIAAEKLGVSYELIRSILILLKLPEEAQQLVKNGKILYDAAQRIYRVKGVKRQIEVANAIAGLPSHKAREIIHYAKKYPNSALANYKRRVIAASTPGREKIHLAIIPLQTKIFEQLQRRSEKEKISVEKLIVDIVNQWIQKRGGSSR